MGKTIKVNLFYQDGSSVYVTNLSPLIEGWGKIQGYDYRLKE